MSEIIERDMVRYGFQPSNEVLGRWLSTRKIRPFVFGTVLPPGLITTVDHGLDWTLTWLVVPLEGYGLGAIFLVSGRDPLVFVPILLGVFMLDVALALLTHRRAKKECLARNFLAVPELLVTDQDKRAGFVATHRRTLRKLRRATYAWGSLLWILALVKAAVFAGLHAQDPMLGQVWIWTILASYLLSAYVHINHTGFAIAHRWMTQLFRKDLIRHQDEQRGDNREDVASPYTSTANVVAAEFAGHTVTPNSNGFELRAKGILTDRQLTSLAGKQDQDQRAWAEVVRAGIHLQITRILKVVP